MPKAKKSRSTKTRSDPSETDKSASKPSSRPNDEPTTSSDNQNGQISKSTAGDSYLLLVHLISTSDPTISRLLSVPSKYTFEKLHRVLQIAFGWASCHAYSFSVAKLSEPGEPPSYMSKYSRELLNLVLDDEIKDAFPEPEKIKKVSDYTLADIYDGEQYRGKVEVSYEYDHGDSWEHQIVFLGHADPTLRQAMGIPDEMEVVCLGGEGHPCAEDCGSTPGWEDLKDLFKSKTKRDPDGRRQWYKTYCANGDPKGLDPWKWSIFEVNDALADIKG